MGGVSTKAKRPSGLTDLSEDATRDISAALNGLLADVRSAHMPMEVLGLQIEREGDPIDRNVVPPILRALHACSVEAAKYLFFVWQLEQFAVYETCMAKHGQRFD
jgi:hypothetical protein